MTRPDAARAGVPCWIDTLQPDPRAARDFYGSLLGGDFGEPGPMPGGLPGEYVVARLGGRAVAGLGTLPDLGGPASAVWNTHVRVDDADAAVERVRQLGGGLLLGPLEASDDGRVAVLVDPAGAAFSVWQARRRSGVEV